MGKQLTEEQQREFEAIDKVRTNAMEKAEKKCRKLRMGEISWCPKMQKVRFKIQYFSLSRRKLTGRKVSSSLLLRLSKRTGCIAINMKEQEILNQIDELYKEYRELKKHHILHREEFLTELAAALEKDGRGQKAKIIQQ